jgi:ADP-dependent NAD(P)H-hydrate dehydratase / NAD(P)H-hydrate epimerase
VKPVCTGSEVRELDRYTIDEAGVPGIALMELASRGVAEIIALNFAAEAAEGVVVVCGGGNNGGDGYGCARWLHGWGFPVSVYSTQEASTGDAALMRSGCGRVGVKDTTTLGRPGLIVDALFGTGLSRPLEGRYARLVQDINAAAAPVVAVDIPSGICADTGAVLGVAVAAQVTVTFGVRKRGFYGEPGADYVGRLVLIDIGLNHAPIPPGPRWVEAADLDQAWPTRQAGDHKGKSGHLLVVAGSAQMSGAAVLCCQAALASGVGLVTLLTARGAYPRIEGLGPEVMIRFGGEGDRVEGIPTELLDKATAVVCGPGLGGGEPLTQSMHTALREIWTQGALPVLFDADALGCAQGGSVAPRVISPHPGEAGRLLDCTAAVVQADRFAAVQALAADGVVALLKGRNTLIGQGDSVFVNSTGCQVLATAGSGDVLSGMIGALLARGLEPLVAAQLAAFVHGTAGDRLAEARQQGWTAGDIALVIPEVVEGLL